MASRAEGSGVRPWTAFFLLALLEQEIGPIPCERDKPKAEKGELSESYGERGHESGVGHTHGV